MSAPVSPHLPTRADDGKEIGRLDSEVVELALLLPRWQAAALEAAARRRGMTTGQMLRRVIGELLGGSPPATGT